MASRFTQSFVQQVKMMMLSVVLSIDAVNRDDTEISIRAKTRITNDVKAKEGIVKIQQI